MTKFEELVKRGRLEIHFIQGTYSIRHLVEKDVAARAFYFVDDTDLVRAMRQLWDKEEYLFHTTTSPME